jgi:photosystem II stability/assembly factor-like uncharacterized protein
VKHKLLFTLFVIVAAVLILFAVASAQAPVTTYQQIATIALPGGLTSFDISWADPANSRFYLADRTSAKGPTASTWSIPRRIHFCTPSPPTRRS